MKIRQVIVALVVATVFSRVAYAEIEKVGDYTWQYFIKDGKAWIGSQVVNTAAISPKPIGEVTVPSELGGYEVFRIDDYAFYGCDEMTTLIIPDGVRQMGVSVCRQCAALKEMNLPSLLEWIPENAFRACSSLTEVRLPPSVIGIDDNSPFGDCTSLTNVVIPESVRYIGDDAFLACHSLKELVVPSSVTNIGKYAFSYCDHLKCLTLPFVGSSRGNSESPESVFGHIFGLSKSEGLIKVEQTYANGETVSHYIPSSLKRVVITDEKVLGEGAFENCSNLTSIVIGNSVTNIAKGVFSGCSRLESLSLPFIGSKRGNTGVKEAVLGHVFGTVAVADMVRIRQSLALDASEWATNYFPSSLTSIIVTDETVVGYGAFFACDMLTNVTLNCGISSIGGYAFRNCTGLKKVIIPEGVKKLDIASFRGCGLEHVLVSLSVTTMEDLVFEGCQSLRVAYVPRRFKDKLMQNVFANCADDVQIVYYDENMRFLYETLQTENASSTSIVAVCTNACRVSFEWKSSCEPLVKGTPYDYLSFEIDGVSQNFICGETDWTAMSYTVVGEGEHTFRWIYRKDAEDFAGEDCGWVRHAVVAPLITLSFDGGDATDGEVPAPMSFYADQDSKLPDRGTLAFANHSFAGWSDGAVVYAAGEICPYLKAEQKLTAIWTENRLSAPVIKAPETYEAKSTTVTIEAEDKTTIYYTLDGSRPNTTSLRYVEPFEIEGNATIRAVATRDNYFDSEEALLTVARLTWTYGEYLNSSQNEFITGGNAEWVRVKDVSLDGYALKSGPVTHSQTSKIETVVCGSGIVRFLCKVEGEVYKKIVYDGLSFSIDGIQQGELIGDEVWTEKSYTVDGSGAHTLTWAYVKDESGDGVGGDCAWLDMVSWTPAEVVVDIGEGKSVVVPVEWIDSHADIIAAAGGDKAAALRQTAANGRKVWECFMLGVDPTKADDDFKITRFWMEGGMPMFEFSHSTDGAGNSFVPRLKVKGKAELSDGWSDVPESGNSTFRFFTVEVTLP